jgi:hypothetical protein
MLTKESKVDLIETLEDGCVQVRTRTRIIEEDGVTVYSGVYHRHVVAPGDDYSTEDARVQAICAATHTVDVVAAYRAAQEAAQAKIGG